MKMGRLEIKADPYHGWYVAWFTGHCWRGSYGPLGSCLWDAFLAAMGKRRVI